MRKFFGRAKYTKAELSDTVTYSNMFWLFMLGNVLGVVFEGLWCYFRLGHWETHVVTIWGPFCLIYGVGIVLLYILSVKLYGKNVLIRFASIALILSAFEYFCGWLLDRWLGMKAWDYTGCFMNINGRVSLGMTLMWGAGGIAFAFLFISPIFSLLKKMQGKAWKAACTALSVFMAVNIMATGVCLVRWTQRRRNLEPSSSIGRIVDSRYDDEFMKTRFVEWKFIE